MQQPGCSTRGSASRGTLGETYLHPAAGKQNNTRSVLKVQSHFVLSSKRPRLVSLRSKAPAKPVIARAVTFKEVNLNSPWICALPSHLPAARWLKTSLPASLPKKQPLRELSSGTEHADGSLASLIPLGMEDASIPSLSLAQKMPGGTDRQMNNTARSCKKIKPKSRKMQIKSLFLHPHPGTARYRHRYPKSSLGMINHSRCAGICQETFKSPITLSSESQNPTDPLTAPFPMLRFLNNLPICLKPLPLIC